MVSFWRLFEEHKYRRNENEKQLVHFSNAHRTGWNRSSLEDPNCEWEVWRLQITGWTARSESGSSIMISDFISLLDTFCSFLPAVLWHWYLSLRFFDPMQIESIVLFCCLNACCLLLFDVLFRCMVRWSLKPRLIPNVGHIGSEATYTFLSMSIIAMLLPSVSVRSPSHYLLITGLSFVSQWNRSTDRHSTMQKSKYEES